MPGFEIFGDEERREVQDVLDSGVLFRYGFDKARNGKWKVNTFENDFSKFVGSKHCLLCSSGTTALSTTLAACGVGFGDEVIVPPFTFVATIEAVLSIGAIPVFVEIDETLCIDPLKLEQIITFRTKALIAVHMCGAMAQIDKIKEITDYYDILLIEDACQATGANINGKYAGTFGIAGCFSFDSVKTITCGEAGGIVTDNKQIYLNADAYHDHGHDHIGSDRGAEKHNIIGMNYRVSELNAAVGVAQLRKINKILEIQKKNQKRIHESLEKFDNVQLRHIPDKNGDSATFATFMLPTEEITRKVANELNQARVDGTFYWYDNNWHYFRKWDHIKNMNTAMILPQTSLDFFPDYNKIRLPQSDSIMSRTISIQIKLSWTEQEFEIRCNRIEEVLRNNL
jgi:8-amino-3,8-dideoxy-alpha-D-manno-octulosonate transaminase